MTNYSVLIADHSAVKRKEVSAIISIQEELYIAGKARNLTDAYEKIKTLKPNLILINIGLFEQNQLRSLQELSEEIRAKFIVYANSLDKKEEALQYGLTHYILEDNLAHYLEMYVVESIQKILIEENKANLLLLEQKKAIKIAEDSQIQNQDLPLITIGASTGGPAALQKILAGLEKTFVVPILIVQHMPVGFTAGLAKRLDGQCALHVKELVHNEIIRTGYVYIAPAGIHTLIKRNEKNQLVTKLSETSDIHSLYKPSVDVTLNSVATSVGDKATVFILTGMGDDGLRGCGDIKTAKGQIYTQSEETCVVYGMPKVVDESLLSDGIVHIEQIKDKMIGIFDGNIIS